MASTYYILSLLITLFYTILCIASLVQLSRILYYKHNIRSFHFAFLLLTFTWSLFRILFFGTTSSIPSLFSLILFWFPVDIQFATFSLIVVFYSYLLHKHNWNKRRIFILSVYLLVNTSIFILTCMYVYVSCMQSNNNNANNNTNIGGNYYQIENPQGPDTTTPQPQSPPITQNPNTDTNNINNNTPTSLLTSECNVSEGLERTHHMYMFLQFVLLLTVYGYYLYKLHQQSYKIYTPLTIVSLFVWMCFLSRCCYCLLAAFNIYSIEIAGNLGGIKQVGWLAFNLLLLWEILPMSVFLLYFRHIPANKNYNNNDNYYIDNGNNINYYNPNDLDASASLLGLSRRDSVGAAIASLDTDIAAANQAESYLDSTNMYDNIDNLSTIRFSFSPQNHGLFYNTENNNPTALNDTNNTNNIGIGAINNQYFQSFNNEGIGPCDNLTGYDPRNSINNNTNIPNNYSSNITAPIPQRPVVANYLTNNDDDDDEA